MSSHETTEIAEPGEGRGLLRRFREVRATSEGLASPLSPEDCTIQSMPDASPTKWHLAHTSWFFETFVLERFVGGYVPFDRSYRYLFNSYYQTVGEQYPRPKRGLLSRPGLDEVLAYRSYVSRHTCQALDAPRLDAELTGLVELGLHHEQQHQELILTDVKHMLSQNPLFPAYHKGESTDDVDPGPIRWLEFEGGRCWVGDDGEGFAFDNEEPRHEALVRPFLLASRPVTNGEFRAFIEDGGYDEPTLWLSDGWAVREREAWSAPLYWLRGGEPPQVHTLAGARPLAADEPVTHLSYYEADAYARWVGARLPTEFEWEVAACDEPVEGNFLESGFLHPRPSAKQNGLCQIFGDTWEWTRSPYTPYPGYRPQSGALGEYNGKFMCNQLVLRGGSCATPRSHIRVTYRNFFPPDARWQFSGVRLARDLD